MPSFPEIPRTHFYGDELEMTFYDAFLDGFGFDMGTAGAMTGAVTEIGIRPSLKVGEATSKLVKNLEFGEADVLVHEYLMTLVSLVK
jgi:hypothetical protein